MNAGDKWFVLLSVIVTALLSTSLSLIVSWLWFHLGEENWQCGYRLRSAMTQRTIESLLLFFLDGSTGIT